MPLLRGSKSVLKALELAQSAHNSDLSRIPYPAQEDFTGAARYRREMEYLRAFAPGSKE